MKKYFVFAIAALGMIAGCQKNRIEPAPMEEGTPVPVSFGVSAPAVEITKAAVEEWGAQDLYIYGIDRAQTDFTSAALFINNVKVAAPTTGTDGEITPQREVNGTFEPYYYNATNTTYDFYGYYVDSACGVGVDPAPSVTADAISLPIEIDGSQDIMLAKADQTVDVGTTGVLPERAYSAYSARKGVTPKLVFEHMLARFDFNVIAGDDDAVDNVTISNVTIKNAAVKGQLNIVGAERGVVADTTAAVQDLVLGAVAKAPTSVSDKTPLGASLMVFPGQTQYTLDFDLQQTGVQSPIESNPITLNVASFIPASGSAHTAFTAGYKYVVTIKVYSNRPVEIIAELDEWEDAGEYEYDPDNEWAPIVTEVVNASATVVDDTDQTAFEAFFTGFDWAAAQATLPWVGVKADPAIPAGTKIQVEVFDGTTPVNVTLKDGNWPADAVVSGNVATMTCPSDITIISFEAKDELGWNGTDPMPAYVIKVSTIK